MTRPASAFLARSRHRPDMDAILGGRRMRRNRRTAWSRRLVRESTLTVDDLIWPLFLTDRARRSEPVAAMPGVVRLTVDGVVAEVRRARDLGIPAIALFPNTDPKLRDDVGSEALNPDNLVCRGAAAPSRRRCPRSASSPTWRSTPIPATAMTASCRARRSSTTRPSSGWWCRRWSRPRPAPTSSRRRT